jgi:hypothetical protein
MTNEKLNQRLKQMQTPQEVFGDFKEVAIDRLRTNLQPCNREEMQLYGIHFMKLDEEPLWIVEAKSGRSKPTNSERAELASKIEGVAYGCGCGNEESKGYGSQKEPMRACLQGDPRRLVIPFDPVLSSVYPRGLSKYAEPIILNMFNKAFNGTCDFNDNYPTMYSNFLSDQLINKHPQLYLALARSKLARKFERYERQAGEIVSRMIHGVEELVEKKLKK